jgi:hydroxymethylglutaryl-CoA synthase
MSRAGITSYGISIPRRRLKVEEILELWMNSTLETVKEGQGVCERGVLGLDEDTNTYAVAAAKAAIEKTGRDDLIDALYLGTCTNPYDSRPSCTIILEALDLPYSTKCGDLQFATKSGTSALIHAVAMVDADLARGAIAIGADTMNRHTAPGDLTEPYASSGAGALLVGTDDVILEIEGIESYASDLTDGFRVEGDRYIRTGMLLGSAKNEVGAYAHASGAGQRLLDRLGLKPSDYRFAVCQQSTPAAASGMGRQLGFSAEQMAPAVFADLLGDTGSAAPLIGLAKVLEVAEPGDRIFLVSYGFGAGADAFSFKVTPNIKNLLKSKTVVELLNNKEMVDYKKAMKLEYKYIRPQHPLTAYL